MQVAALEVPAVAIHAAVSTLVEWIAVSVVILRPVRLMVVSGVYQTIARKAVVYISLVTPVATMAWRWRILVMPKSAFAK